MTRVDSFQSNSKMDLLDQNVIFEIVRRLSPEDVLAFRYAFSKFFRMDVFGRLMELHYPDSVLTGDPERQYIAITRKFRTYYLVDMHQWDGVQMFGEVRQLSAPTQELRTHVGLWQEASYGAYPYDHRVGAMIPERKLTVKMEGDEVFYVKGLAIPPGTKMWFGYANTAWGYELVLYPTRRQLAKGVAEWKDDYLWELVDQFEGREIGDADDKVLTMHEFNEFVKAKVGLSLFPFTEEVITEYIMKRNEFPTHELKDFNQLHWVFFEMTF